MVCYWRLMTIGKTRPSRKKFHRSVWHLATKMTPRCYWHSLPGITLRSSEVPQGALALRKLETKELRW